jgi:hypothetical protein
LPDRTTIGRRLADRFPLGGVGDAHYRWPVERCAVGVERRPVDGLIACAARPGGVPAAVTLGAAPSDAGGRDRPATIVPAESPEGD